MIRKFLGKSNDPDQGADRGVLISESHYTKAHKAGDTVDIEVLCEAVTEREARVLLDEILAVTSEGHLRITLDMSHVSMLASAGIGTLVQVHKQIQSMDGKFALYGLNKDLSQLMKLTRMHKLFSITSDRASALAAVE